MPFQADYSDAEAFTGGLKGRLARLSLGFQQEREETDHNRFSPTHFSVDLFAPHHTTKQIVGNFVDKDSDLQVEASTSSSSLGESDDMSPTEQAEQMLAMLDALKQLNHPGNDTLTEEEWAELEMTWSVPIAGSRMDLIAGGHIVSVPLQDKDEYCEKASEALLVCVKQAEKFASR